MKIFSDGADCPQCQRWRIERGFKKLGHQIVLDISKADLIYINNPWYDSIYKVNILKNKVKIILNILDLAPHLGDDFPLEKLKKCLKMSDAVTCISETVRDDCTERLNITPHVIYNPIMDVFLQKNPKPRKFRALASGRLLDPNKRSHLGLMALQVLGVKSEEIAICGSEYPGYGENLGIVGVDTLRELYNEVDFVLVTSRHEGLGLQVPEAMAAGAIPVICNDLSTKQEFLPSIYFPEYDEVYPNVISLVHFISRYMGSQENMLDFKSRIYTYYNAKLAHKFSDIGVAKSILDIYYKL